jgi:hypothetical protein
MTVSTAIEKWRSIAIEKCRSVAPIWSSAERLGVGPGRPFADDPDLAVKRLLEFGGEGGGERRQDFGGDHEDPLVVAGDPSDPQRLGVAVVGEQPLSFFAFGFCDHAIGVSGLFRAGFASVGVVWALLRPSARWLRGIGRPDFVVLSAVGWLAEEVAAASESPGGPVDGEDLGVVQEPVEDRDGLDFVAEQIGPFNCSWHTFVGADIARSSALSAVRASP